MTRRVGFGDREPAQRPSQDSANGKAGWVPYLDPDEEILWTGQPLPGLSFKPSDILLSGFGLFFFSFAVFWTFMASGAGAAGGIIGYVFPLFGIPFILVGGYLLFGRFFWEAYVRSKTRYALTNRRAIIAKSALNRSMTSHPITATSEIEIVVGPPDTVNFATRFVRSKNGGHDVPVGFERIEEGMTVYNILRQIKRERGR